MPSSTDPVRFIQVGAGSMGRAWLRNLARSDDAELVGLVDLDPAIADQALQETGLPPVPTAQTLEQLLDTVEADAVINVTIPEAHVAVSNTALLRGLPVLSEKPAADTTSAALSMAAAADVSGRLLMISQSRRYYRNVDGFRRQIGQLGRLGLVECSFFKAPHFGGFRDEMAYPLLVDMAIHQFDLARHLIGAEPVSIFCESFNPAWSWYAGDAAAHVSADFADGTRFGFVGSWCSPGLETSWNGSWRVSGTDGSALWDGDHEPTAQTAAGEDIPVQLGTGPEEIAGSLAEFIAALRGGPVPAGEVHSNVISLLMVEGAVRSAETQRRVVLADLLEESYAKALAAEKNPVLRAALESWPSVHEVIGRPSSISSSVDPAPAHS
jgi:predicted dehydrogenase